MNVFPLWLWVEYLGANLMMPQWWSNSLPTCLGFESTRRYTEYISRYFCGERFRKYKHLEYGQHHCIGWGPRMMKKGRRPKCQRSSFLASWLENLMWLTSCLECLLPSLAHHDGLWLQILEEKTFPSISYSLSSNFPIITIYQWLCWFSWHIATINKQSLN